MDLAFERLFVDMERANVTIPLSMRPEGSKPGHFKGVIPHLDVNIFDMHRRRQCGTEDAPLTEQELAITRNREKPNMRLRDVQACLNLSDCKGGVDQGSMGFFVGSPALVRRCAEIADGRVYGRSDRAPVTRMGEDPLIHCGCLDAPTQPDPECYCHKIKECHREIRQGQVYPPCRVGDIYLWTRETVHTGPYKGNASQVPQIRVYMNTMRDTPLNKQYVERQLKPAIQERSHSHGPAAQKDADRDLEPPLSWMSERQKYLFGFCD